MTRLGMVILALCASTASAAPYAWTENWTIGQEREVDAGVYAKLYARQHGWSIWRFETENSISCDAVKPSNGKRHVYPLGSGLNLWGAQSSPWVDLVHSNTDPTDISLYLYGRWRKTTDEEYRSIGDKFFKPMESLQIVPSEVEGKSIEVHVRSWEYPELDIGLADEYGIVNLTGITWALEQKARCAGKSVTGREDD